MASKALVNLICGIKERGVPFTVQVGLRLACAVEWEPSFRVQIRKRAVTVTEKQSGAACGLLVYLVTRVRSATRENPYPRISSDASLCLSVEKQGRNRFHFSFPADVSLLIYCICQSDISPQNTDMTCPLW